MNFLYFRSFYLTLFGNVAHFCLLSINFQLFCQISADNFRKVRNITDVSKILTKYLFFRCEIFFLSCEYPQNTDIKITQTPHFCCCIRDCSLSLIRLRIFYEFFIFSFVLFNTFWKCCTFLSIIRQSPAVLSDICRQFSKSSQYHGCKQNPYQISFFPLRDLFPLLRIPPEH